jgi:hypothetical protein
MLDHHALLFEIEWSRTLRLSIILNTVNCSRHTGLPAAQGFLTSQPHSINILPV